MSTMMVPPTLPIGNKQDTSSLSNAPPGKGGDGKGSYTGKANRRSGKGGRERRDWADYTPTPSPWMDYTPTPWGGVDPYGFGMAQAPNMGPPPGADAPNLMPPPPHMSMGLPMQPPPRIASMAAAAAAAAAGAAAAAAAACDVNAAATASSGEHDQGMSDNQSPPTIGVKNTFIHLEEHEDQDEFGLPSKSKTMPDLKKKAPPTPGAIGTQQAMSASAGFICEQIPQQGSNSAPGSFPEGSPLPENLTSRGAVLHGSGKCRPCAWFWKPQGCHNGAECSYCHSCSQSELKSRKKTKVAAMRMGALLPASKAPGQSAQNGAPSRVLKLSPLI